MDELKLRRLAKLARTLLPSLILDKVAANRLDVAIASALALPKGCAEPALWAALSSHPVLRKWTAAQLTDPCAIEFLPRSSVPSSSQFDDDDLDDVTWRGGNADETAPITSEPPPRYLTTLLPERAPTGRRISLIVAITLTSPKGQSSARLKALDVPPGGTTVTVVVSAPGLVAQGDLEQDLHVPVTGNPDPIRFGFLARPVGLHTVMVQAYRRRTFLGEVRAQVSVEAGAALSEGRLHTVELETLAAEPGEVTLLVNRIDHEHYSFQLLGGTWYSSEPTQQLAGDPSKVVSEIAAELRTMAAGTSVFATPALVRNRLRNLGTQLWSAAVPEAIQRQFWEQADRIRTFTIASDRDIVPWELLYPLNWDADNGFLVEQFPVVRRVFDQGRAVRLPMASAAYVVPPGAPDNALAEVQAIRARLGKGMIDRGVVTRLDELIVLLDSVPGLLHFACHNTFTDQAGSSIMLDGGPLRPTDLAVAVQKKIMATASPLVFFNACRTAGEAPWMAEMMGWAKQFVRAGAGAFIGSLWAVQSSAARIFADAFYDAFVTQRLPLGPASLRARQAIADQTGDPTWLAYTVYGNPAATIAS